MSKIVIVSNGNYFAKIILNKLSDEYKNNIGGVIIVYGDYYSGTGLKTLWSVGSVTVLQYIIYKVFQFIVFKIARVVFRNTEFFVEDLAKAFNIPVLLVKNINSHQAIEFIRKMDPELLVSVSCPQRISEKLINLARHGGVNIHSSLLPAYAGLAPYYWVLSKGERVTGVSVHYMMKDFDAGNILVQKTMHIKPRISAFKLFKNLSKLGSSALLEGVKLALNGEIGSPQEHSKRSYNSHPTRQSYKELKQRGYALLRLPEIFRTIAEEVKNH